MTQILRARTGQERVETLEFAHSRHDLVPFVRRLSAPIGCGVALAVDLCIQFRAQGGQLRRQLLQRLDQEYPVQASAIRQAAKQGGRIDRGKVYELGGYDPERQPKGFTRPIKRMVQDLRDRGVVPEEAVDVLATEYDHAKFGWASGFVLAEELIPLLDF